MASAPPRGSTSAPSAGTRTRSTSRPTQHNFVVSLNGQRRVVTFDDDELEDLTADPRLQILVEGDLREFLHDACAETYCPAESVFPW